MNKLKFWNAFPQSDRFTFLVTFGISIVLIISLAVANIINIELVLQWDNKIESESIPVVVDSFNTLLYNFDIEIDQYLVFNYFDTSSLHIKSWSWNVYLIFYGFSISLIVAAISTIEKRLYYYAGISIFSLIIISLRIDALLLFGNKNPYLIGLFIIPYLGLSYYLHAFADHVGMFKRILYFLILTTVLGLVAIKFSALHNPSVHLADYAAMGGSVLSLFFILSISHDNIWLITRLTAGSNSLNPNANFYNYIAISLLYLVFPILLFLKIQGYIQFDLIYLNPIYLLAISSIVSIWAVRKRAFLYKSVFRYDPVGKYLHFGLLLLTFALLTFNYLTFNSSYIILFEKIIIFSHISFGCVFFFYVGFNFAGEFMENLQVYKVIFEGKRLPYLSVGFTSLGMMFLIMWTNNHMQYKQWLSGTFNLLGETEMINGSDLMSSKFYQTSLLYHNHNFKASYNLGQKALQSGDHTLAESYFNSAAKFSEAKSPMTFIKLANEYKHKNVGLGEIWVLDEANKNFPESGEVLTNKGAALSNNGFIDTAMICYQKAALILNTDEAKANGIGILAKGEFRDNRITEALLENSNNRHYQSIINLSALYNIQGSKNKIPFKAIDLEKDKLTTEHLAYIHNYTLNSSLTENIALKKELLKLQKRLYTSDFVTDMSFLLGYYEFYNNNKQTAISYFEQTMSNAPLELIPYYGLAIGQLLMSADYIDLAKPFLEKSIKTQRFNAINNAPILGVISSVHTNDTSLFEFASSIIRQDDSTNQQIVAELRPIIYLQDTKELINYSDRQKVMFAQVRPELIFESDHATILNSFEDLNLKGLYIAASMDWFSKFQIPELNNYYWERIPESEMTDYTINELNYQYINMLTLSYKFNEIIDRIPTMTFNAIREKDIYRISGMALQALGDTESAQVQYNNAIKIDGLNPTLLTDVSKFYKKTQSKKEAYELISIAVQLYPNDITINKEYCIQALENKEYHVAEQTLIDLSDLLKPEEFELFKSKYEALEAELDLTPENW